MKMFGFGQDIGIDLGTANVLIYIKGKDNITIDSFNIYDNNGKQFTTGESYQCAIKSFKTIMGEDCIKGFNIGVPELQKWKEGMLNGVKDKNGKLVGKISETTCGIYLRCCRTIWNRCVSMGFLVDAKYPFSNKEELGLVSIPKGKLRRKFHLNVQRMTELYKLFITKNYPKHWKKDYIERANHSLGLFLTQYLCNGFNMADAGRLTYDEYYFQTEAEEEAYDEEDAEHETMEF